MTVLEFAFSSLMLGDDACVACLLLVVIPVLIGLLKGKLRFDFRIPLVLIILFLFVAIIPLFSVSVGWRFDYAYILLSMFLWPLWIPVIVHYCRLVKFVGLSTDCFFPRAKLTFLIGLILLPLVWKCLQVMYISTITYFKAPDETWPVLAYEVMWFRILFAALLSLVIYMMAWMLYCKGQHMNGGLAKSLEDDAGA